MQSIKSVTDGWNSSSGSKH